MVITPTSDLSEEETGKLWDVVNKIPDDLLLGYLEDGIIDEAEMQEIIMRLESIAAHYSIDLKIGEAHHTLIRGLVVYSVEMIKHGEVTTNVEQHLCPLTMQDVKAAMGYLIETGQLQIGETSVCGKPTPGTFAGAGYGQSKGEGLSY